MKAPEFFDLLQIEVENNPALQGYYKFNKKNSKSDYAFRKNYYIQRLEYIEKNVGLKALNIWDCGCGYGTTAIFLVLNGHSVYGNTLEFYVEQFGSRRKYWERYGKLDNLKLDYKDHFDITDRNQYDVVIAQDTLHHLEPVEIALQIISDSLKPGGRLIAIEENGKNLFNSFKNYMRRGNKRVKEIYDERLQKKYLLGDENTRYITEWDKILNGHQLYINSGSIEFIRLYLPFFYRFFSVDKLFKSEKALWKKNYFLKRFFYFGTNFFAEKK
jgi:SAM-dependent methyltransferase